MNLNVQEDEDEEDESLECKATEKFLWPSCEFNISACQYQLYLFKDIVINIYK